MAAPYRRNIIAGLAGLTAFGLGASAAWAKQPAKKAPSRTAKKTAKQPAKQPARQATARTAKKTAEPWKMSEAVREAWVTVAVLREAPRAFGT